MKFRSSVLGTSLTLLLATAAAAQTTTAPPTTTETTTTQTQPTMTTEPATTTQTTTTQPTTTPGGTPGTTTESTTTQTTPTTTPDGQAATTTTETTTTETQVTAATADDLKKGASVYDQTGALVGKVDSAKADSAVLNTGKARAEIPLASFGKNEKGLVVSITKADIDDQAKSAKKPK
ncbi:hypothetical protein [Sphingomonas daechungensis]|uniref:hypothetical protein n=1 Tax=Sphingomonas daechungensis TaxID=1176646 RepID=UPI003784B30E